MIISTEFFFTKLRENQTCNSGICSGICDSSSAAWMLLGGLLLTSGEKGPGFSDICPQWDQPSIINYPSNIYKCRPMTNSEFIFCLMYASECNNYQEAKVYKIVYKMDWREKVLLNWYLRCCLILMCHSEIQWFKKRACKKENALLTVRILFLES